ncbi:MAG TPA: S-layer homology domain-containing protein [Candidatus Angelobacter sp.]|nr:S-layer homology domain-containing protein [Candidatus Angelobacter sp.]
MATTHRPRRIGAIVPLLLALLATPMLAAPAGASEPPAIERHEGATPERDDGGTLGAVACLLEVASSDEFFGPAALAVPDEDILLWGEGWAPAGAVDLWAEHPSFPAEYFPILTEPSGVFFEVFAASRGAYGTWTFNAYQGSPDCTASVAVDVLPLADVLTNRFLHDIKWLYHEGITSGCGGDLYCPNGSVTRGQMATFLVRALGLPPTSTDYFTDDAGNKHEGNINRLRAARITYGCTETRYCPDGAVTRGQMAAFIHRAKR